jgi:hypothetical protein
MPSQIVPGLLRPAKERFFASLRMTVRKGLTPKALKTYTLWAGTNI